MQRIIQFLKWLVDWDGERFQGEVDRLVAKNRQWNAYERSRRIGPTGPSGAHAVDLDHPDRITLPNGAQLWVDRNLGETKIIIHCRGAGYSILELGPADAQWLLKAIRQQNNIVKQRLGIAPYDDQRPGSTLDGKRREPVDYSKEPQWLDKGGFTY